MTLNGLHGVTSQKPELFIEVRSQYLIEEAEEKDGGQSVPRPSL
jgi:hypothetical protein